MKIKLPPSRKSRAALDPNPSPTARSGISPKPRRMWINGDWVASASGQTFPTHNPATGEILCRIQSGHAEDIDRAVKAARRAFESGPWRRFTPSERGRLLWKLADLLEAHTDEFARLEALDNGKPMSVARVADVPLAVDLFRYMAGWATKIEGSTLPISVPYAPGQKFLAYTQREPIGVVGQIRIWRNCRRRTRVASGRRQDRIHGIHRGRQTHRERCGGEFEESDPGARRKVAQHRV